MKTKMEFNSENIDFVVNSINSNSDWLPSYIRLKVSELSESVTIVLKTQHLLSDSIAAYNDAFYERLETDLEKIGIERRNIMYNITRTTFWW